MFLRKLSAMAVSAAIAGGVAAPAFAMNIGVGAELHHASSASVQVDGACMGSAVDKRDTAIVTAFDTFAATMKTGFATRTSAEKTAWAITDATQRRNALKAAWKAFASWTKTARTAYRTSQKAAWTQFKTDAKTCKGSPSEEGGAETSSELSL